MDTKVVRDQGQSIRPYGYVIGVFETKEAVDKVCAQVDRSPVSTDTVRILHGDEGAKLWQRSDTFFFADGEHKAIQDYTYELQQGNYVVAFRVEGEEEAESLAHMGTSVGGRNFTYFGNLVITRFTK